MTINELIKTYCIHEENGNLRIMNVAQMKRDNALDEIKAKKPEIIAHIVEERETARRAVEDRKNRINAIEGLAEIKKAIEDNSNYRREFARAMQNEDCGGLGLRPAPKQNIAAMMADYPRAAAYIKAESYANKANDRLASIGKRALEAVIFGDYEAAMQQMDKEIEAFTNGIN